MLEDLHIGVSVLGNAGQRLGTLQRIVVARTGGQVTHLVVDPGVAESGHLLTPGGWEEPRERVVPIALLASADAQQITLACDQAQLQQQPLFEHRYYAQTETEVDAAGSAAHHRFRLGDLVNYIAAGIGLGAAPYEPSTAAVQLHEAAGSVEIAEGTPVWRRQPHEEVGTVERLLMDPQTQRLVALVVTRKGLRGASVQVPLDAIADLEDGLVHVTLSDEQLDELAPYEEER